MLRMPRRRAFEPFASSGGLTLGLGYGLGRKDSPIYAHFYIDGQ
jgi:hypothetical protein